MTYDLFKKLPGGVFFVKPDFNHTPKAIAAFNITHPLRNEVRIRLGVGNPSNPEKERYFRANLNLYLMEQWNNEEYDRVPMPDSNIVIDITEFLPLNNDTVFIEIYDKDDSSVTGTINYFAIELYDDYSQAPTDSYVAAAMPVDTVDGETVAVSIGNIQSQQILASIKRTSSDNNGWLELETRPAELEDISNLNLLETNSLYFSTGLRKLSDEGLKNIIDEGNLRVVNKAVFHSFIGQPADTIYDNSTSKFFPPIGNQKQKNSCVSWAVGYYIMSYYTAWKNDWDLSVIEWNGGDIAEDHQHKIMSPDFLFNLINGGLNIGSYVYDSFNIVNEIGISSLKTMPIIDDDFTSWPTEEAWREASNNRIVEDKNVYYVPIKNDDDIEIVKNLLRQGYLMRMAWNGYNPRYFSNNDGLTTTNNIITGSNHASTIVGYADDWTAEF